MLARTEEIFPWLVSSSVVGHVEEDEESNTKWVEKKKKRFCSWRNKVDGKSDEDEVLSKNVERGDGDGMRRRRPWEGEEEVNVVDDEKVGSKRQAEHEEEQRATQRGGKKNDADDLRNML